MRLGECLESHQRNITEVTMTLPTLSVVRKTKEATNSTKGGDFLVSLYGVQYPVTPLLITEWLAVSRL